MKEEWEEKEKGWKRKEIKLIKQKKRDYGE